MPWSVVGNAPTRSSLVELRFEVVLEFSDEFVVVHQLHFMTTPEEAWIVGEDTASPPIFSVATPCKDALVG